MIQLRPSDLSIGDYVDKKTGRNVEIVQLSWFLATDPTFIEECRHAGVQDRLRREPVHDDDPSDADSKDIKFTEPE